MNDSISFVLPTFNEEKFLGATLTSILTFCPAELVGEILVVDHGSSDATPEIARQMARLVPASDAVTIGQLRNIGASKAKSEILIFLDADVRLTEGWRGSIGETIRLLEKERALVTGSRVGVSANPTWLERYWFEPMIYEASSHISTGHLIVRRDYFFEVGGFDETMETGEDYEFSQRAKQKGARLVRNQALTVSHEGYPKTLTDFIEREIWHGRGDAVSLKAVLESKVALLSIAFIAMHAALAVDLVFILGSWPFWLVAIVGVCAGASFTKYRSSRLSVRIIGTGLFYFYFFGRALALIARKRNPTRRQR